MKLNLVARRSLLIAGMVLAAFPAYPQECVTCWSGSCASLQSDLPACATGARPEAAARPASPVASAPSTGTIAQASSIISGKLAVLEFDRKAGGIDGRIDRSYFSDAVRAVAKRVAPGLFVMTREGVTALLSANGVKLEDCFSDCEVETGRKLGADYVVSGRLMKMGARFLLTMRLHKTQTAELLNTARAQGATIEELIDGTDAAAAELFRLDPAQAREQQASVPKPSRQDKGGARIPLPAKALAKDLRVAVASEGEGAARLADAAVRALAAAGLRPSIGHGPRDFDAKIAASADTTLSPPWTTIRQVAHVRLMDRAGVVLIAFELTAKASAGDAAEASRRGTADIAAQLESRLAGELRAIMRSH